jgi:hypothetical protein
VKSTRLRLPRGWRHFGGGNECRSQHNLTPPLLMHAKQPLTSP